VKRESYCLFSLPPPIFEGNYSKDIRLVEYKEKLVITCRDMESDFMEIWVMKSYNGKIWRKRNLINIEVLTKK
jgi:hypothetical protein